VKADVIIVGAGISGLVCARELARAGRSPRLLEKSRGVGGRCATRLVDGQPVDHGLAFYHGRDPELLRELESAAPGDLLPGWPEIREGDGRPCQAHSFAPGEWRLGYAGGVNAYPRWLARDLAVELHTRVTGLAAVPGGLRLETEDGATLEAPDVVIAMPAPQALVLVESLPVDDPSLRSALALLRMVGTVACLTVLAGYGAGAVPPSWQLLYPEDSSSMLLVSHDSAKRRDPDGLVLVHQARPGWSRTHLEDDPERWKTALLAEAGRLVGDWAARPVWSQAHRWRYARADAGSELTRSLLLPLPGGARLGLVGEVFSPGGGVQASWTSGREMARRLMERSS
jgi:predicted NAD/FAD-dependent oxidoreductase